MWRRWVALAALLATACSADRATSVAAVLDAAQEASRRGNLTEALGLIDRELARRPADDQSAAGWQLRLQRADVLLMRREVDAAAAIVDAEMQDSDVLAPLQARRAYLQARIHVERGDLDGAMRRLHDAPPGDADTSLDRDLLIGRIQLQRGEFDDAQRTLSGALAPSADRYRQLVALNNLGNGQLRRGRYDEALTWLERALALSEFEGTTSYATAMANAGICYSRLGLFDRAIEIQRRAVEIQRAHGGPSALVDALGSLGVTYGLRSDHAGALGFFQQALDAATRAGLRRDAALWAGNIASAHIKLGHWDLADAANRESLALASEDAAASVYHTLNAADIALGRGQVDAANALFESALGSAPTPSVQWSAHAGLAQVALRRRQPEIANRHFEHALAILERTRLDLLRTDYKLSFLTQLIEFYQQYVDSLVAQGRSDRALEIADSSRGRVLAERQRVAAPARATAAGFRQIASRTRTTLLSYWLAPARSFLWVVTASGVRRIDLSGAAELEAIVRNYRAVVDNSLADPLAASGGPGDRLYQLLIAPTGLPEGAAVVVVPDGALHGINFETLPVGEGGSRRYWIADAQVQVAPSLGMLTAAPTPAPAPAGGKLLLIGNPTPRAPEFPALSYAPAEMTSIVRHFNQERVTAYDSARATPAVYQSAALDRYSMIHFTAHATANVESPLDSAVVLSGPDTAYKLYARDVADKPLAADLVTVSACRSAGERAYSGEGLVGFAWAFLRAGAKRVVAGLWDVDDRSTAQLMDQLYAGIERGETPAAALRAAKLALIAEGRQLSRPYYWGPFQVFTVAP